MPSLSGALSCCFFSMGANGSATVKASSFGANERQPAGGEVWPTKIGNAIATQIRVNMVTRFQERRFTSQSRSAPASPRARNDRATILPFLQAFENALEVVIGFEMNNDLTLVLAEDTNFDGRRQLLSQLVFQASDVSGLAVVGRRSAGGILAVGALRLGGAVLLFAQQRFGRLDAQTERDDLLEVGDLLFLAFDALEQLGVGFTELAEADAFLHFRREFE